jgi:AcrR family transcriptional regulator
MSRAREKPMTPRRAKTRQRLIEAAAQAIAEKGFRDTTLDEIAARAGMTKGAIYDNFASKDDLFVAIMSSKPNRMPLPANADASTPEKLAQMAKAVTANTDANRLQIPLRAEFLLYTLTHPELRKTVEPWLVQGLDWEEAALKEKFSAEELPMSPRAFVVMMQAMIPGLTYLRSQSPEQINDEIVAEIFAALAPKR